jgi:hypothetical protein
MLIYVYHHKYINIHYDGKAYWAEEEPEIQFYTPNFTMISHFIAKLGGQEQFKDLPIVRLLDSAVQGSHEITINCSRLEFALEKSF